MAEQQAVAGAEPGLLFNLGRENSRAVIAFPTGGAGRRLWPERWDWRPAGRATAEKKDAVSGAEEQQVASPVEAVIALVFVETQGTHLRVSSRKKEAVVAFIQDGSSARAQIIGLSEKRRCGMSWLGEARSETVERQCIQLLLFKEKQTAQEQGIDTPMEHWQSVLVDPVPYGFRTEQPLRSRIPHAARCA